MLGKTNADSFTLLELLIVLVIIGILATLANAKYKDVVERAQARQALTKMSALRAAEFAYRAELGVYYATYWLPAPVPPDGGYDAWDWNGTLPNDFPKITADRYFTYKLVKETAWGAGLPGNFHIGAYKRRDPGFNTYYYMDVDTGKVYKCWTPYDPANVIEYKQ